MSAKSRQYKILPHIDFSGATQFVTFRLHDSLPRILFDELELHNLTLSEAMQKRIPDDLDRGLGLCHLRRFEISLIVENHLLLFDTIKYILHAWVIMPNHVHILLTMKETYSLASFIKHHKSFTAREINKKFDVSKPFWAKNYFDRFIRDEAHFFNTASYIEMNPVMAGLCNDSSDWRFSSAWKDRSKGSSL